MRMEMLKTYGFRGQPTCLLQAEVSSFWPFKVFFMVKFLLHSLVFSPSLSFFQLLLGLSTSCLFSISLCLFTSFILPFNSISLLLLLILLIFCPWISFFCFWILFFCFWTFHFSSSEFHFSASALFTSHLLPLLIFWFRSPPSVSLFFWSLLSLFLASVSFSNSFLFFWFFTFFSFC